MYYTILYKVRFQKKNLDGKKDTWKNGKSKYQKMDETVKKRGLMFLVAPLFLNFFN